MAAIAALGGFLFGYDTGVIGGALLCITPDTHLGTGQQQAVVSRSWSAPSWGRSSRATWPTASAGAPPGSSRAAPTCASCPRARAGLLEIREEEAREVLRGARASDDVNDEIREIRQVAEQESSLREVFARAVRPMLLVSLGLAIFQQIVGINTVIYYTPTLPKFAGYQNVNALTQTVYVGPHQGRLHDRGGAPARPVPPPLLPALRHLLPPRALIGMGLFF